MSFGESWFEKCKLAQLLRRWFGMSESAAGWTAALVALAGVWLLTAAVWLLVLKIRGCGGG